MKFSLRYILISIVFFAFTNSAYAFSWQADSILKISENATYNIVPYLSYYETGAAPVDINAAYQFFRAGKFIPVKNTNTEFINDGLVNSEKWIALPLINTTNSDVIMMLKSIISQKNDLEFYAINEWGQPEAINMYSDSAIHAGLLSKPINASISMQAGERKIMFIHSINRGQMCYLPSSISTLSYGQKNEILNNNFLGIFKGIFFFIIIFNLAVFIATRELIYLYYTLYAFAISAFALNDSGAAAGEYSIITLFNFLSGNSFLFLGFTCWLLLMKLFIDVSEKNTTINGFLKILSSLDFVFALLPLCFSFVPPSVLKTSQQVYQTLAEALYIFNIIFIIVANIVQIAAGNKLAIFYASANIPVVLGTLLYYTNYYNITNIQFRFLNPIALGISIETFVLSFGFAYRYDLLGKEKNNLLSALNTQLQNTTRQIIQTQEAERSRIAGDLHDQLGGDLAAIKLSVQKLPVDKSMYLPIISMLDTASAEVRNISHNLMPPAFEKTKLQVLLSNYYNQLSTQGNIHFNFIQVGEGERFSKNDELIIYRILMEITSNIIKHSNATESNIQMIYTETGLDIMTEDNGKGMTEETGNGLGMKSIKSRVDFLNGNMNIDTSIAGTTIIIQIPYKQDMK